MELLVLLFFFFTFFFSFFFLKSKHTQDSVLTTPQPNYEMIKECYPHYFHKLDRTGNYYCFFCQPGLLNMQAMTDNNVSSCLFVAVVVVCCLFAVLLLFVCLFVCLFVVAGMRKLLNKNNFASFLFSLLSSLLSPLSSLCVHWYT